MPQNFDEAKLRSYFADPNILLNDIDAALETVPIEKLPLTALSADPSFKDGYRKVVGSRPRHLILETILNESHANLKDFCCVQWRYCEMKVKHGETINLVKALLDAWVSVALVFPLPIATVAAYCVQSLFLDQLCDCSGPPRP